MLLNWQLAVGGVFFLWLLGLTIWLWRIRRRQTRLSWGGKGAGLEEILSEMGGRIEKVVGDHSQTKGDLEEATQAARKFLQKVSMVRYNPFPETGGDHSFSLTLLDGEGNGMIMTGLHMAREGTRVYVKPIKKGKAEYQLSREEEKSLKEALK